MDILKRALFVILFSALLGAAAMAKEAEMNNSDSILNLGRFGFTLSPKVLEDGSIIAFSMSYRYTEKFAGELRLRYTSESYNERLYEELEESLVTTDNMIFETFFLPVEYHFFRSPKVKFALGGGLYYEYNTVNQKGYFNKTALPQPLNMYSNDFSMHVLGPLLDASFACRSDWFYSSLSAGIVPVFFLQRDQSLMINPTMGAAPFEYSQKTSGSPYFYADLSVILLKYLSLSLLYEYSKLDYDVISFDTSGNWAAMEQEPVSHTVNFEISLLLPLGSINAQIGYGHMLNLVVMDAASPAENGKHYFILGVKRIGF
jgi:hypothetical protein